MEPANEEASPPPPVQRLSPASSPPTATSSTISNENALVAAAVSSGVSVSNGTVLPTSQMSHVSAPKQRPVSGVVPPYWRHYRDVSRVSQTSLDGAPGEPSITLEDHTEDPESETSRGLWAKSVTIDDYVVVQGKTGVGAYVVWNCKIQTLDGGPMIIRLRYSEFDDLRQRLLLAFPNCKHALPLLPPKSVFFKFRPSFLENRRVGLEYFFNCVLLHPQFSGSPVLKDFLFSHLN